LVICKPIVTNPQFKSNLGLQMIGSEQKELSIGLTTKNLLYAIYICLTNMLYPFHSESQSSTKKQYRGFNKNAYHPIELNFLSDFHKYHVATLL